ncbi:MAG: flavoprotein [Candidatus Omnitrophica bacterium]|nr:flavoprotein [Candidatus Omnitrophota bacterium]
MKKKNVVLAVTGSIAAYKACDLIRALQKLGFLVTVIMTKEAKEFVTALTFKELSKNKVYEGMFDKDADFDIEHISLAEKADLILIAPATANIIGKIANGICDDLLSCTVMATKKPVLIASAMNENMYTNRIVQANINKLKSLGYKFVQPRRGELACGRVGWGCLAETEVIVKEAKKCLGR